MESTNSIIGITGKARSGKDTLANYLVQEYGFTRFAFADPMKQCLAQIPGWGHDHLHGHKKDQVDPYYGISPRVAMQRFGTDWGRSLHPDFWIKVAGRFLVQQNHQWPLVISDVRFNNEAEFVRRRGLLIHLHRPQAPAVAHHASEAGVSLEIDDVTIKNDGTIDQLHTKVDDLMVMIKQYGMFGGKSIAS